MRMLSFLFALVALAYMAPTLPAEPLRESAPAAADSVAPPQVPLIFQAGPDWGRG
jgi:hypothetical protein